MEPLVPQNRQMKCQVCGHPLGDRGPRKQRLYHDACKKMKNYLDAAVRAAKEMEQRPTPEGSTNIRRMAMKASNQMAALAQQRDEYGRFC